MLARVLRLLRFAWCGASIGAKGKYVQERALSCTAAATIRNQCAPMYGLSGCRVLEELGSA